MSQSHGDILEMTYDWITRVLYLSVSTVMVESTNNSRFLTIWSLPVDNPVFRMIHGGNVLSDDTKIVMTIAPRIGYVVCVCMRTCVLYACMYMLACVYMHSCVHACMHACMHACVHLRVSTCVSVCDCVHVTVHMRL